MCRGGVANAKPRYLLDASGGYNNQHEPVSYTANNKGGIWPYSHIYAVKGTILSDFSRPKVT